MTSSTAGIVELSLIIPAFNESAIIERNVGELERWLGENMPGLDYEILVVDDGSTDGTGALVEQLGKSRPRVRVSYHPWNQGRGRAIRTGFDDSRGAYVICLDADLSYSPEHIISLLEPLKAGRADITLASAYHPQGAVENVPWSRVVMSRLANKILSRGLRGKYNTVTCVVRGYTREILDLLELVNNGKDLHLEIIQKAEMFGLRVVEVPARLKWRDRNRGTKRKARLIDYIPFLSMSGTIVSHLVYTFLLRPGSFLNIPVIGLMLAAMVGSCVLLYEWVSRILRASEGLSFDLFFGTLRDTLLQGGLTMAIVLASVVISLIFVAFYFTSHQSKRNFEEMYILTTRVNARIKNLERRIKD